MANVFTASATEQVSAVGFYTPVVNSQYEIYVYSGVGTTPRSGTLVTSKSGTIAVPGYHTVSLTPGQVTNGQKFSVVIKLVTPGENYGYVMEYPFTDYSSGASASAGQSYISSDGTGWNDLTTYFANTNACIKAYTTAGGSTGTGSISITSSPSGAAVYLDGTSQSKTTPASLTGVTAGTHTVRLTLSGYNDYSTTATVTDGGTATVSATMTPTSSGTGSISVTSIPSGAAIYLDGSSTGRTTSSTLTSVTAGTHTVRLTLSGYNDYSTSVTVTSGQTAYASGSLSQTTGGSTTPNDPSYGSLWAMPKIQAPQAWSINTGSRQVIVAVVDTGVDYTHPDLVDNMWTNPNEIPNNGIDDDGNGLVDDVRGWDYYNNDNNPYDDNSHGTHCAGTIGATGNNGIGVAGINWQVKIMPLKFLGSDGSGSSSNAAKAILYANSKGATAISNSWGGGSYNQLLYDAISASSAVVVFAAGNDYGSNNDVTTYYPASYNCAQIIAVASTTETDGLSSFSNYGPTTVDVGAPGSNIYSTTPGSSYGTKSGTSMATPLVAGLAGLLKSANPSLTNSQIKSAIMTNVDSISALSGKCVSGGRINAYKAVSAIGSPVDAVFYGTPGNAVLPMTVQFTDASTGSPTSWSWSFGDGGTSTAQNPSHSYSTVGSYTVTLVAARGAVSDSKTGTVVVRSLPPFLTGWTYRKLAPIGGSSSGDLTDYQVRFKVWRSSGTDSGENVYVGTNVKSDYSDLRFTDTSNTLLSYWIESSDSTSAVVWVKVASIPTTGNQVYVYYGNAGAVSASNGANTFVFFDDFTTVGSSWTQWRSKCKRFGCIVE